MWGYRGSVVGNECLRCGVRFGILERHPDVLGRIDGHPSPCPNIGRWIYEPKVLEQGDPWVKTLVRWDPVEIENRDPLWME